MNLECPKCGHKWNYKGNQSRAQCSVCKFRHNRITWIKTGLTSPSTSPTSPSTSPISDDIMQDKDLVVFKEITIEEKVDVLLKKKRVG